MDRLAKIDKDELIRHMRGEFEATMEHVAKAVNAAPDGHLIDGSDGACRNALMEFMRVTYEKALQMRVGATCRKPEVKRESPAAAALDHFFDLRGAF